MPKNSIQSKSRQGLQIKLSFKPVCEHTQFCWPGKLQVYFKVFTTCTKFFFSVETTTQSHFSVEFFNMGTNMERIR